MSRAKMTETVTNQRILDSTVALVTFANGTVRSLESEFDAAMNGGASYSGAHWTTFEQFQKRTERIVREAQEQWGLPAAEIVYTHVRRTVETIERTTDVSRIHATRTVKAEEAAA